MPRSIRAASFVTSAAGPRDFPADGLPEVAMVGRSNVGKSTLINVLIRKDLARTSASPGKTRLVNVYRIVPAGRPPFYLVDLPGYGHAGGGDKARGEFAALTSAYFGAAAAKGSVRRSLAGIVLAIDARHPGMESDIDSCRWLLALGLPFLLVATKVDKLSQAEKARLPRECERTLGAAPLAVSSVTGEGLDELWRWIRETSSILHSQFATLNRHAER